MSDQAVIDDLDSTTSRLSPIGSISFASIKDIDAEVDYPPVANYPLHGPLSEHSFLNEVVWLDVVRGETDNVLVSSKRFGIYGVGASLDEAVEDASEMLLAHYEDLLESEDDLPTFYQKRLRRLRAILVAE